jgi:2-polyprenyl-3-methyl-5-hydroxy-6-metoxy-1,4-benzoquinol methylase
MQMKVADISSFVAETSAASARSCLVCGHRGIEELLQAPDRFHGGTEVYRLARCLSCSLVWLDNPPRPEEMGEHYGPDYDRSVAAAGDAPERWRGRVEVIAQHKSGGSLLDLGCSSGGFLQAMRSPSWRLHGIEMSHAVAKRAESATGAQVFVGDILDAPFGPASFDVITCFHVFEHLYEPQAVLRKIAEWLKPGGIFYVMVPNIDSAGARIFGSYWYALELPRHLYHFSPKSLGNLANSLGLEQVLLTKNREIFLENSVRYLLDDMFQRAGLPRAPLARVKQPGIPFRVIRKAFRLTVLPVLSRIAALAGDGESIHGIFRKQAAGANAST